MSRGGKNGDGDKIYTEAADYSSCDDNARIVKAGYASTDWYYKLVDCDCEKDIICTTKTYSASDEQPVAYTKAGRCQTFEEKKKEDYLLSV